MWPSTARIIVLSAFRAETVFPLLLQRLNIYTDPQRPMTQEEGIYEINNPGPDSPVAGNHQLLPDLLLSWPERSRLRGWPTWLLIKDSEGLSVLTAWAAGKFAGDDVGMFIKKCGIEEKINHKSVIIPGYAAAISGEMEEELPGWNVQIGPREAAHLPKYLKDWSA